MKRDEAIIDAGMKRARPIVMTTIAMVAGMVPSALAFGAGGEFRSPMAIAVIGGLMFSTVLSLLFVPAMFMMMDDLGDCSGASASSSSSRRGDEEPPSGHAGAPPQTARRRRPRSATACAAAAAASSH